MHVMGRPHVLGRGCMRGSSLCFTAATIRSKKNLVFGIVPLLKLLYGTIRTDSIYKGEKTNHNQNRAK